MLRMMIIQPGKTVLKSILSFAKFSPYKMIGVVFIVISTVSAIYYTGKSAGYNSAKAQELKAVNAAEKVLQDKYDKIIARKSREQNAALRLIERLRNRPEVTHSEIKEAANASSCKHLGLKFNSVFNKLVDVPPVD